MTAFFLLVLGLNDAGKKKKRIFQPRDPWKTEVQKKGEKKGQINKKFCYSDIVTVRWLLMSVDGSVSGPTDIKKR